MKDMKEPSAQPTGSGEKKGRIVDLTSDMELRDKTKGKIIDLINSLHGPSEGLAESNAEPQPVPTESPDAAEASQDKLTLGTPADVEADVDAAFDAMQDQVPDETSARAADATKVEGDDLDLSESLSGLSMDDTPPIPPVQDKADRNVEIGGEEEPELELFPEADDDTPSAAAIADQDETALDDAEISGAVSDDLQSKLQDVDAGDTIELTDVVVPVDLGTPLTPDDTLEERQPAEAVTDQPSDEVVAASDEPDAEEEDAIELTDIIETETATVEQAEEIDAFREAEEDEEVIELDDIVKFEELEQDEDIIELTDIVDPAELAAVTDAVQRTALQGQEDDEEVIELTDIVDPEEPDALEAADLTTNSGLEDMNATEISVSEATEEIPPLPPETAEDKVIRLDSVLAHVRQNKTKIVENLSQGLDEAIGEPSPASDATDDGIDIKEIREALGEPSELTDKELEEAIEKIIRTKYAETIEKHIAAAVEKVVTREMESIKRDLMEDQDPDD